MNSNRQRTGTTQDIPIERVDHDISDMALVEYCGAINPRPHRKNISLIRERKGRGVLIWVLLGQRCKEGREIHLLFWSGWVALSPAKLESYIHLTQPVLDQFHVGFTFQAVLCTDFFLP
jgi:hypothetical protein